MSTQYLSEIRIFTFNFAPKGWAMCNGQLLPISQNGALFSLLGTIYGGDGSVNFGLPNLQTRVPMHSADGFTLGMSGGEQGHDLALAEMPLHVHALQASTSAANTLTAEGNLLATPSAPMYAPSDSNDLTLSPLAVSVAGANQQHENMSPYLTLNFCIALQGIFPSRN